MNLLPHVVAADLGKSPPSRAAWIETRAAEDAVIKEDVAAFTGGVD